MPVIPPVSKTHKFDLSTDVVIEYKAPNAGVFTWNLSAWDSGDNWADTSTISWKPISAEVVNLNYSQQTPLGDGYQNLVATTVSLTLAGDTLNPEIEKTAYTGLPIKITIKAENGNDTLFFYGRIRSYSVNYVPGVRRNEITIEATDGLDNYLNTLLTVDLPIQTAYARISAVNTLMETLGLNQIYVDGVNTYYTFDALVGTYTVGEIIKPLLQFLRTKNLYTYSEFSGNYWANITPYETGGTADIVLSDLADQQTQYLRYYSIASGTDNTTVYNQVKVIDNTETVVAAKTSTDGIQLYGVNSIDFQTNVTSPTTNGSLWAEAIIADTNNKTYSNVGVDAIDRNGYLSYWALKLPFYAEVILETSRTGVAKTYQATKTALQMNIDATGVTFTIELAKPIGV